MAPTVEDRLRTIAADHLGVEDRFVTAEAKFIDNLGADSLDTVELVMKAEDEFEIVIEDWELAKLATFGDALRLVETKLGAKKAA